MENENMTTVVETTQETKKPKAWVAILVSLGVLLAFFGIQIATSMVASTVASISFYSEHSTEDLQEVQEAFLAYVQTSDFITPVLVVSQILTVIIGGIWFYFGYVKKADKAVRKENNKKIWTAKALATVVLLAIGCYCFDIVVVQIVATLNPAALETFETMMNMALGETSVLSIIATVLLAPIGEEILFRGIAFNKLKKALPIWVAIILQAVLFGAAHANLMQFCYVIPIALVLGYVAYRYDSIIPCIGIHMVNNALPNLVVLLPEAVRETVIPFIIVSIIAFAIVIFVQKDKLFTKNA